MSERRYSRSDEPPSGYPEPDSTYRLIREIQAGDDEAVERLCQRYLPRMKRWAHGRLPRCARSLQDTDDLVQDVLVATVQSLARFEYRRSRALQAYVRRALKNKIWQEMRNSRRRPDSVEIEEHAAIEYRSPLEDLVATNVIRNYEDALERLKPSDREAVVARVELGCSYAEIADALDKPTESAARKAVSRALFRLAREMGRDQ